MTSDDVSLLHERAAISDLVVRYATGVDRRDWALYRSCFTDPVTIDFSSWNRSPERTVPVDDWVAGVRGTLSGFDATQHLSANHVFRFDGADRAVVVSQMQATHALGEEVCVLGGHYTNAVVRQGGEWRIARCELTVTWRTGPVSLFDRARERVRSGEA